MRGKNAREGDERTAPNGYRYIKAPQGWRLKHHVIAEEVLGRPLADDERVTFIDGDRTNLSPDNLRVSVKKNTQTKEARAALIRAKIAELEAELHEITRERET